jgi:hypothetical protein
MLPVTAVLRNTKLPTATNPKRIVIALPVCFFNVKT